uniref:Type ISP restriction-modification enzyme coupler domain-containing protein n=1 Tax=Candidatus Kentrum sp. LPFa TaxID=2126335 RepID=A0A450W847_9GAMM|nr:MAG: hypothetical protein BECKLPF1236A_GA0070988_100842 [Candidatus Kentron sp. LPFa]VFK24458.1 MAG: hypothetical protein BECKLPF1236C_GA0070990_1001314 [Candidatus Kentron sp. LPFa]
MKPHEALADNKTYKVVWEVLQALRSHDDRFDAMINKLDLTGAPPTKMEVIAVTDQTVRSAKKQRQNLRERLAGQARGQAIGVPASAPDPAIQTEIEFTPGELERALYARIVEKCGRRAYWEDWAGDIARIASTHITRIQTIVEDPANRKEQKAFRSFVKELRDDLNPAVTEAEVIEMLAQHLITRPVFEALFEGPGDGGHGHPINADDHPIDDHQQITDGHGRRIHVHRQTTDTHGHNIDVHGQTTNGHGHPANVRESKTDGHDHPINVHGHHAHVHGRAIHDDSTSSNGFAANNPVSQGMQKVLSLLHQHHLEKETDTLQAFYASVRMRAEGIDNAAGRQRIVLDLYDKFFRNAFPRLTERLGIVYTPVEVETATKELSGTISIWLSW